MSMLDFEALAAEHGRLLFEGAAYILLEEAAPALDKDDALVYQASAISLADAWKDDDDQAVAEPLEGGSAWRPVYTVTWRCTNPSAPDKQSACDWEKPESIRQYGEMDAAGWVFTD